MLAASAGLAAMARLQADSTWIVLLPGLLLAGIGVGITTQGRVLAVAEQPYRPRHPESRAVRGNADAPCLQRSGTRPLWPGCGSLEGGIVNCIDAADPPPKEIVSAMTEIRTD